jgi:hypothetical protein
MPWMRNNYACDCGEEWQDEWSCGCDDECPRCGSDVSPDESEELPSEDCEACGGAGVVPAGDCKRCDGHGCTPTR